MGLDTLNNKDKPYQGNNVVAEHLDPTCKKQRDKPNKDQVDEVRKKVSIISNKEHDPDNKPHN